MNQKAISWSRRYYLLIWYSGWQSIGLFVMFSILIILYFPLRQSDFSQDIWTWIDPVAGISAFILSLIILYNQAYAKWEESLDKRLTVHYVNTKDNQEVAIIEQAYLSGQADIRPWAQQLGRQIFGEMEFDMNWDDDTPPQIILESHQGKSSFVNVYEITIYIHYNDKLPKENIASFLKRTFKHSIIKGDADNLPVRWIRKNSNNIRSKKNTNLIHHS